MPVVSPEKLAKLQQNADDVRNVSSHPEEYEQGTKKKKKKKKKTKNTTSELGLTFFSQICIMAHVVRRSCSSVSAVWRLTIV